MRFYKEKVTKRMRKKCSYCTQIPKGTRILMKEPGRKNENVEAFCGVTCGKRWFANQIASAK